MLAQKIKCWPGSCKLPAPGFTYTEVNVMCTSGCRPTAPVKERWNIYKPRVLKTHLQSLFHVRSDTGTVLKGSQGRSSTTWGCPTRGYFGTTLVNQGLCTLNQALSFEPSFKSPWLSTEVHILEKPQELHGQTLWDAWEYSRTIFQIKKPNGRGNSQENGSAEEPRPSISEAVKIILVPGWNRKSTIKKQYLCQGG